MKSALMGIVHLFLVFLIFSLGCFFIGFSHISSLRYMLASIIMYNESLFLPLGIVLIIMAVLLTAGFCTIHRFRYLQVRMKPFLCEVDLQIITDYLTLYWKKAFPEKEIQTELSFTGERKLEIITYLPPLTIPEQKKLLKNSEKDIGKILRNYLDYRESFVLTFAVK
jgi:hypothetical protein